MKTTDDDDRCQHLCVRKKGKSARCKNKRKYPSRYCGVRTHCEGQQLPGTLFKKQTLTALETLRSFPTLSSFVGIIDHNKELQELVSTAGTILAPTNIALSETFFTEKEEKAFKIEFDRVRPGRKRVFLSGTQKLNMMKYHLLDITMPHRDLLKTTQTQLETKTTDKEKIILSRSQDGVVMFDGRVEIVVPDITTKNATHVIHIVDAVLRPSSMDTPLLKGLRGYPSASKYYSMLCRDKVAMATIVFEENMTLLVPQNSGVPSNSSELIRTSYHTVDGYIDAANFKNVKNRGKIFHISTLEREQSKLSTPESTKEIRVQISTDGTTSFNGTSKLVETLNVSQNVNMCILDSMVQKPEILNFSPLSAFYMKSKIGKTEKKKKVLKMDKISIFYRLMTRSKPWMEWKANMSAESNGHFEIYAPTNTVFMKSVLKRSGDPNQIVEDKTFDFVNTDSDSDQVYQFLQTHVKWRDGPGSSTLEFVKNFLHDVKSTTTEKSEQQAKDLKRQREQQLALRGSQDQQLRERRGGLSAFNESSGQQIGGLDVNPGGRQFSTTRR